MNRRKAFYSLSLFIILFIVGMIYEKSDTALKNLSQAAAVSSSVGAQVGNKAMDFTLVNTKGETVSLSDFNGSSYTLVNFFTTWCGPCLEEMPALVEMDQRFSDDKLTIIGVNLTKQERNVNDIRPFLEHFNAEYEVLFDHDGKVMEAYQLIGIPTSVMIDNNGKIVERINGIVSIEKISNRMQ